MSIDVSQVVVSFGDPGVLFRSLELSMHHLDKINDFNYEIIVIDNFSTHEYRKKLVDNQYRFSSDRIRFFLNSDNPGFGSSCNHGALHARGAVLWFINPDAWVNSTSDLKAMLSFAANDCVGAVSTICRLSDGELAQMPRIRITPIYLFLSNFRLGRLYKKIQSRHHYRHITYAIRKILLLSKSFRDYDSSYTTVNSPQETDVVGGSSLLIQRNLHELLGGFDEDYFLYDEDFDYCLRLKKLGKKNFIHPGAEVGLYVSGTIHNVGNRAIEQHKKNSRLLFINKHFHGPWRRILLMQCNFLW